MQLAIDFTYKPTAGGYIQFEKILEYLPTCYNKINIFHRYQEREIILDIIRKKKNVNLYLMNIPENPLIRFFWHQIIFPFHLLKRRDIDVLFCPGNMVPVLYPKKKVVWVGTIGQFFLNFFKDFPITRKIEMLVSRYMMALSGKISILSFHESEFSRSIYVDRYKISKNRTKVINIGRDKYFYPVSSASTSNYLAKKFGIENDFIFYASHVHPYKNFDRLFKAYSEINNRRKNIPPLIIAGRTNLRYGGHEYYNHLVDLSKKLDISNKVQFLGNISRKDLKYLYSGCKLFIFPSLFESISYTLMEAMACGAPIIASNETAIPEACKYAASYFDPYDEDDMTKKIDNLLVDKIALKKHKKLSLQRIKELPDYEQVNQMTYELIEKSLNT